jgi:hypothetical protein
VGLLIYLIEKREVFVDKRVDNFKRRLGKEKDAGNLTSVN